MQGNSCTYRIKGVKQNFKTKSEAEVYAAVHNMSNSSIYEGVDNASVLREKIEAYFERSKKDMNAYRSKMRHATQTEEQILTIDEQNKHLTSYIGTLTFQDEFGNDVKVITPFNLQDWQDNIKKLPQFADYDTNEETQKSYAKYIAIEQKKWDIIRQAGIIADRLQGCVFDNNIYRYFNIANGVLSLKTDGRNNFRKKFETDKEFETEKNQELLKVFDSLSDKFLVDIAQKAYDIKQTIMAGLDSSQCSFYNQANMSQELKDGSTLRAKADLVVHRQSNSNSSGDVIIIDFKLSGKAYGESGDNGWDISKVYSARTQLEAEKVMLANQGIKQSRIQTALIVSQLEFDESALSFDPNTNKVEIVDGKFCVSGLKSSTYEPIDNHESNDYETKICDVIERELGQGIESLLPETSDIHDTVIKQIQEVFPCALINEQYDYYNFEQSAKNAIKTTTDGKFYFTVYNYGVQQIIKADTYEAILNLYKAHKDEVLSQERNRVANIIGNLKNALLQVNSKNKTRNTVDAFTKNCIQTQLVFQKYFVEGGWKVLDDEEFYDDLLSLNTVVLVNETTKQVDVITISKQANLEQRVILNPQSKARRKTILGYRYDDDLVAQSHNSKNILNNKLGNIMLMRATMIANQVVKSIGSNYKISQIGVLKDNQKGGSWFSEPGNILTENLSWLFEERRQNSEHKDLFDVNLNDDSFISRVDYAYALLKDAASTQSSYNTMNVLSRNFDELKSIINNDNAKEENSTNIIEAKIHKIKLLIKAFQEMSKSFNQQTNFVDQVKNQVSFDIYIYKQIAFALAEDASSIKNLFDLDVEEKWGLTPSIKQLFVENKLGQGTMLDTMDTSKTSLPFYRVLEVCRQNFRTKFNHFDVNTKPLFERIHTSVFQNWTTQRYLDLFYKDPNNKSVFRLKNPYKQEEVKDLSQDQIQWLKDYLHIFAIERFGEDTQERRDSDEYTEIPLYRASAKEKTIEGGVKSAIKEVGKNLSMGDFLQKGMSEEQEEDLMDTVRDYRDITEMYNIFNVGSDTRKKIIDNSIIEDGDPFMHFSYDLENVLYQYVHAKLIKAEYDKVLPTISATIAAISFAGEMSGKSQDQTVEFLTNYLKSTVFNEALHDNTVTYKTISVVKNAVSQSVLGFNAVSGTKECVVGLFTLYNKAISNGLANTIGAMAKSPIHKDAFLGFTSLSKAYSKVWLDALSQPFMISMMERLNNIYGLANMDSKDMAETLTYGVSDYRYRYYLYWFNRAPDFLHRMTFLIGYMIQHGCYDAISIDKNGHLQYDWEKDKRFNLLSDPKADKNSKEYLDQKGLYVSLMNDISEQLDVYDEDLQQWRKVKWDGNFDNKENDELPYPYSREDVNSIAQEANITFGYMDHDTKSMFFKQGIGIMIGQFMTFVSAAKIKWFLQPGTYNRGYRTQKVDVNGNKLYLNQNGKLTTKDHYVTESGQTIHFTPAYEFHYMMMEGIAWSYMNLFKDLFTGNIKQSFQNEYRMNNIFIGLGELLQSLFLYLIGKMFYQKSKEEQSKNKEIAKSSLPEVYNDGFTFNVYSLRLIARIFNNASGDINSIKNVVTMLDMNTPTFDFLVNSGRTVYNFVTGQKSVWSMVGMFGASRVIQPVIAQKEANYRREKRLKASKEKQNSK